MSVSELSDLWRSLLHASPLGIGTRHQFTNAPAFILGKCYKLLGQCQNTTNSNKGKHPHKDHDKDKHRLLQFHLHLYSLIWVSYRSGFPPLKGVATYTSDGGWGCMIRTGQMMMANALVRHWMGINWRLNQLPAKHHKYSQLSTSPDNNTSNHHHNHHSNSRNVSNDDLSPSLGSFHPAYYYLLSLFFDSPSPACSFSLHRMLMDGQSQPEKIGEWSVWEQGQMEESEIVIIMYILFILCCYPFSLLLFVM